MQLDLQDISVIPSIAADALVDGVDSPSLRYLAGMSAREFPEDICDHLRNTASELKLPWPDDVAARMQLLLDCCKRTSCQGEDLLEISKEIYWDIERDDSSIIERHPRMPDVFGRLISPCIADMDEYGGDARSYYDVFRTAAGEFVRWYEENESRGGETIS
ncbi:MAG TPA: hypothetical protein VFL67_20830 [Mycobacterium sp.]|nr:hypothetical protein [Mycobacterium sp.]